MSGTCKSFNLFEKIRDISSAIAIRRCSDLKNHAVKPAGRSFPKFAAMTENLVFNILSIGFRRGNFAAGALLSLKETVARIVPSAE